MIIQAYCECSEKYSRHFLGHFAKPWDDTAGVVRSIVRRKKSALHPEELMCACVHVNECVPWLSSVLPVFHWAAFLGNVPASYPLLQICACLSLSASCPCCRIGFGLVCYMPLYFYFCPAFFLLFLSLSFPFWYFHAVIGIVTLRSALVYYAQIWKRASCCGRCKQWLSIDMVMYCAIKSKKKVLHQLCLLFEVS